jgi:hypothetical protein
MRNTDYDDPARLGRNWNNQMPECMKGANMMEQKRRAIEDGDFRPEVEKLGNIQDQMGHMENHIHFLMNAIDTLESRLHMVLREEPGKAESDGLTKSMSPLASTLLTFNRRLDYASKNIMSLIERLEI